MGQAGDAPADRPSPHSRSSAHLSLPPLRDSIRNKRRNPGSPPHSVGKANRGFFFSGHAAQLSANAMRMPDTMSLDTVLDTIDANLDGSLERLFALLRMQSISTDPAYKGEVRKAAQTLVDQLNALGFDASLRDTPGHPMVVAHHDGPEGAPHVLFYGHYDVQPVDPIALWDTDPFEPTIKEVNGAKRVYARGSSDDKGQLLTFVEACRGWKEATGALPCRVTILFEGEEESGSPSLEPFLEAGQGRVARRYRSRLRHQYVGRQHACHHHGPARHGLRRGDDPRRIPRSPFRLLWRRGAQPDPRSDPHSGRPARRRRLGHAGRLLRWCGGRARRRSPIVGCARLFGGRLSGRGGPVAALRRSQPHRAGTDVVPPHSGSERHRRGLYRGGVQDRHSGTRPRRKCRSASSASRIPTRWPPPSASMSRTVCRKIAASATSPTAATRRPSWTGTCRN